VSEHENTAAKKKPVNYDELFPGRFMKAGLLGGKPVTLRIAAVDKEAFPQDDGSTKVRGYLSFEKTELQLKINSTNGQCLRAMFGDNVQEWVGKRVTFKPDRDKMAGAPVDCIRIAGSPDLPGPLTVEIKLPQRRARSVTLQKTGPARDPGQEG
jgi:hypothetical protein